MDILVRKSDSVLIDIGSSITIVENGVKVDNRIYPDESLYDIFTGIIIPAEVKPRTHIYDDVTGFDINSSYTAKYTINTLGSIVYDLNDKVSDLQSKMSTSNVNTNDVPTHLSDIEDHLDKENSYSVYNGKVNFPNSSAAEHTVTKDITVPSKPQQDNVYELLIFNPSTVTEININIDVLWTDIDGGSRQSRLLDDNIVVGTDSGVAKLIQGSLLANGCRIIFSNVTELASDEGFDVYLRLLKI